MPLTAIHRKRLVAFAGLVPLDGARRPIAVSPGGHVALLGNRAVQVYVSLNGALPDAIPVQSWPCHAKGAAEVGDYSKPLVDVSYGHARHRWSEPKPLGRFASLPEHRTGLRQTWSPSLHTLKALAPVALAAPDDDDDSRPVLAMVKLEPANNDTVTAIACDGFRLHVLRRVPVAGLGIPAMIPAALICALLKTETPTVAIDRIDADTARLDAHDSAGLLVVAATWSDTHTYPDYPTVIPKDRPLSAGTFPADVLLQQAEHPTAMLSGTPIDLRLSDSEPDMPVWRAPFDGADGAERIVTLDPRYVADAMRHLGCAPVTATTPNAKYAPVVFESGDFQATVMPMFCKSIANG